MEDEFSGDPFGLLNKFDETTFCDERQVEQQIVYQAPTYLQNYGQSSASGMTLPAHYLSFQTEMQENHAFGNTSLHNSTSLPYAPELQSFSGPQDPYYLLDPNTDHSFSMTDPVPPHFTPLGTTPSGRKKHQKKIKGLVKNTIYKPSANVLSGSQPLTRETKGVDNTRPIMPDIFSKIDATLLQKLDVCFGEAEVMELRLAELVQKSDMLISKNNLLTQEKTNLEKENAALEEKLEAISNPIFTLNDESSESEVDGSAKKNHVLRPLPAKKAKATIYMRRKQFEELRRKPLKL